jgi:hypothetical protein
MSDGLALARWVIDQRQPEASWPRAAAILLRQDLEKALADYWAAAGWAAMADARFRHQMIALPVCVRGGDDDLALAAAVRHVWLRLTRACHGGIYELAPTRDQLLAWADTIERFRALAAVSAVAAVAASAPRARGAVTP